MLKIINQGYILGISSLFGTTVDTRPKEEEGHIFVMRRASSITERLDIEYISNWY